MSQRVLHVVDQFLGRSETFVYTCIRASERYEPSVLCKSRTNTAEFPFPRLDVCPKPYSKRSVRWWMSSAVEHATGRSPWRRCVEALVKEMQPTLIHAHFGPVGIEMAAVAKAIGVPLVTTLYGADAAVLPYLPQWRDGYTRLFQEGDLFLAEGPEMRKKIIAAGAPPTRVVLQPIALELDRYPTWTPDPAAPTVLFVGRFVDKKGLANAIAAFGRALQVVPAARMAIVGDGPDNAVARAMVDTLGMSATVFFLGMRPHHEVLDRLARAHVLIHPSRTADDGDSEGGAPTILLEAQAIGTPIVATRHADIPTLVPEGDGVFLCAERDVDALGQAIVTALQRRVRSSPAHVAEHHDVKRAMPRRERLYDDAIRARLENKNN